MYVHKSICTKTVKPNSNRVTWNLHMTLSLGYLASARVSDEVLQGAWYRSVLLFPFALVYKTTLLKLYKQRSERSSCKATNLVFQPFELLHSIIFANITIKQSGIFKTKCFTLLISRAEFLSLVMKFRFRGWFVCFEFRKAAHSCEAFQGSRASIALGLFANHLSEIIGNK